MTPQVLDRFSIREASPVPGPAAASAAQPPFAVDDRLDQALGVGKRKRAVRVSDIPFGRTGSRRGELPEVIGQFRPVAGL